MQPCNCLSFSFVLASSLHFVCSQEAVQHRRPGPSLQADSVPLPCRLQPPGVATATHRRPESARHTRPRLATRWKCSQGHRGRRRDTGRTAAHEKQVPVRRRDTGRTAAHEKQVPVRRRDTGCTAAHEKQVPVRRRDTGRTAAHEKQVPVRRRDTRRTAAHEKQVPVRRRDTGRAAAHEKQVPVRRRDTITGVMRFNFSQKLPFTEGS